MTRKLASAGLAVSMIWAVISLVVKGGVLESAVGAACFSLEGHNPCENTQSLCSLSSPVTGTGTCRAYRSTFPNECAPSMISEIGEVGFVLDAPSNETWVCTVQANIRITQGSTAGNWSFDTRTIDTRPTALNETGGTFAGTFGGSFGPLQIAANASDFRQISGMAWGPQLGPFHGGDTVFIRVDGGDDQQGAVFDRVNINAMCCQGF
jgi:hypothetical protein